MTKKFFSYLYQTKVGFLLFLIMLFSMIACAQPTKTPPSAGSVDQEEQIEYSPSQPIYRP